MSNLESNLQTTGAFDASSKLSIGFSPCPNDTFIFDALVHRKIDTEGLDFAPEIADVETLNLRGLKGELDVTKISIAAFFKATSLYRLLNSGGALGTGVGPLLVSKKENTSFAGGEIRRQLVAVPGWNTTANLLFSIFYPHAENKTEMIFSDIEDAVLSGRVEAGVLIHENRFTYEQRGLIKISDLGELWEKQMALPVPLGGIVARRNLPEATVQKIDRVIRRSVEFAFANPESSADYVGHHAQEMDEAVRRKHIELYVNQYSLDLGDKGRQAILALFQKAKKMNNIAEWQEDLFMNQQIESI